MKLNSIKIDGLKVAANIFSFGYIGYIHAKEIAGLPCFSEVRLKGELLNVMWLVPLISSLYALSYFGNFILTLFYGGDSSGALIDILFVYVGATAIFQLLSSLLSMQIAKEVDFESRIDKIKFVVFGLSAGQGLVNDIRRGAEMGSDAQDTNE